MAKKTDQVVAYYEEIDEQTGQRKYSVESIAEAFEISPRTVRGYVYRKRHPEKYKAMVQKWLDKRRAANGQAPAVQPAQSLQRKTKKELLALIMASATKPRAAKPKVAAPIKALKQTAKPKLTEKKIQKAIKIEDKIALKIAKQPAEKPAVKAQKKAAKKTAA